MASPIKLYQPRIYLDTNILISALLESNVQWKANHAGEYQTKANQIDSSNEIFFKWEHRADQLKTSVSRVNFDDLVMHNIQSYKAPGFEIMLFQKVSELANKYD